MKGQKGEKRRRELLEIAYRLFIQKGYENTSIEDILAQANIAKGTYYYYFPSKQATLEAGIDWMISQEVKQARLVLQSSLPVPQKLVAVIAALRPQQEEESIADSLNSSENIVMHQKIKKRIVKEATPLLAKVVEEGIEQGIFSCENIEERVKMILILSQHLFDEGDYSAGDVEVFIEMVEKSLGASEGSLGFVRNLIQ